MSIKCSSYGPKTTARAFAVGLVALAALAGGSAGAAADSIGEAPRRNVQYQFKDTAGRCLTDSPFVP